MISIITVSYNSSRTIKETLQSVESQTFKNYEHIVIDGLSTDNTCKIVKTFKNTKLKSEKDKGIYDAMNKGIALAKGEILVILNSDDLFFDKYTLDYINNTFQETNCDYLTGSIVYFNEKNKITRKWIVDNSTFRIKRGEHPPHPGLVVKKSIYDKIGKFNDTFKIAADYDFICRLISTPNLKGTASKRPIVRMRNSGVSGTMKGRLRGAREIIEIRKTLKLHHNFVALCYRFHMKLKQYYLNRAKHSS